MQGGVPTLNCYPRNFDYWVWWRKGSRIRTNRLIEMQTIRHPFQFRQPVGQASTRLVRTMLVGGVLAVGFALAPARADDWSDCTLAGGPKAEQACTAVITEGVRSPQDLANAYARRGNV